MSTSDSRELNISQRETSFLEALFPVAVLLTLIVVGLIVWPAMFKDPDDPTKGLRIPLELIFILAAFVTVIQLRILGHRWIDVQATIVAKLARALPAFFILFSIGLIISSWIVCGTIPMLVYWGLKIIHPNYLYIVAFVAPIVFSTLTGTSYGSVGTIGVVIISIATAFEANLGITAGAVIGGAYFGDKMSPLSDTTNLAALAADVGLYDHIKSMMWTTVPSALMAGVAYFLLGFVYPPTAEGDMKMLEPFLNSLDEIFNFSWFLLLPPIIVLVGSLFRMPTVPVLIVSIVSASILALLTQPFAINDVIVSLHTGFDSASMVTWAPNLPGNVRELIDRGGLYALNEAIITAFMVFIFIGAMEHIRAMPTVVNRLMATVSSARMTILASLAATGITNALTSNQYATSFIVGDAFKSKYDAMKIPRRVLSRSLEDTGTMIESIIPWTVTAITMVQFLGVPFGDYWYWQLLSLVNIAVAVFLAATGIGCFIGRNAANE